MALFLFVAKTSIAARSSSRKIPNFVLLRNEADPRDQRADRFHGLHPGGLVLQAVMEGLVGNRTLHFRFKIRSVVTFIELT